MTNKTSSEIRQEFLDFFAARRHAIIPSSPVVPNDDPTLLFTNAGMNPFKPIFLGREKELEFAGKKWSRVADTQKCIRVSGKHNDLEEVGYDTYHHTLFEMLGNWSFGDYFKKEAIEWAWELLVDVWKLDPERLYVTVFEGDEHDGLPADQEAEELWKNHTSVNPKHILRFGKKDNFWEMGETGPCGPCSEIHIDLRTNEERRAIDGALLVNADDPRVMEIWNLVFIQYNRHNDGSLEKLPAQHVDTGMGFERICAVIQGKSSNYDSDVFLPLITEITKIAGIKYGESPKKDIAVRVIVDHIRAVSFAIADGASPGNDGRGYVVRRILRRAVRYGWDSLNLKEPFFHKLVSVVAIQFEDVFPELKKQLSFVESIVLGEEKNFLNTLGQGIDLFNKAAENGSVISGEDAFKLHDTYGFPIDLTQLMAREKNISVDIEGFDSFMKQQKERGRNAGKFNPNDQESIDWTILIPAQKTEFIGYDFLEAECRISAIRSLKNSIQIQLDKTPFYAESGGQVGDTGTISNGSETLKVVDVQKEGDRFIHFTDKLPSDPKGSWIAKVDSKRRSEIENHHTATHLLHASLRKILGKHVMQKGSLVDSKHLRFDFSHFEGVQSAQLEEIERMVNFKIRKNIPLEELRNIPIEKAREMGAMMLFGEKYGDFVRVITFDKDFSRELCGGTHVKSTGEIGYFKIISEVSVAAGIRRIEAVAGEPAQMVLQQEKVLLQELTSLLGKVKDPLKALQKLIEEKKQAEKLVEKLTQESAQNTLNEILSRPVILNESVNVYIGEIPNADASILKNLGYEAINMMNERSVVVLGSSNVQEQKVVVMAAITDDLLKSSGLNAGKLVGHLGKQLGGGGGGQANLATAGGRTPEKLPEVLQDVSSWVESQLK